jgi:hypothetical protein
VQSAARQEVLYGGRKSKTPAGCRRDEMAKGLTSEEVSYMIAELRQ